MAVSYKPPVDDNLDWQQRLANYGQNTNSGMDEYKRALGVARSKKALGDTAGYDAANTWAGQVDTAIGGMGSRPGNETRSALETYKSNIDKPRAQFSYNPNSDQAYQSALQAAQRSAQTAGNNATVRLGARGIGNSQQALTTENQIQQRSVADVNSNILPQLMNQAYSRFHDNQVMDSQNNDKYLQYANSLNGLNQQDFNNNRLTQGDERQKQQDHINYADKLTNAYGVNVAPKDDPYYAYKQVEGLTPLAMREYTDKQNATAFDQQYKTDSLANSVGREARLSSSPSGSGGSSKSPAGTTPKVSTAQVNDMYDTLQKRYGVATYKDTGTKDKDGQPIYDTTGEVRYKNTTNPDQQVKMLTEILNAGLSDDQTLQLINKLGMTEEEARNLLGG